MRRYWIIPRSRSVFYDYSYVLFLLIIEWPAPPFCSLAELRLIEVFSKNRIYIGPAGGKLKKLQMQLSPNSFLTQLPIKSPVLILQHDKLFLIPRNRNSHSQLAIRNQRKKTFHSSSGGGGTEHRENNLFISLISSRGSFRLLTKK